MMEIEHLNFYRDRYQQGLHDMKATKKFHQTKVYNMEQFMECVINPQQLTFLDGAMLKIIEARKVLAMSYVLGYYMDPEYKLKDFFNIKQDKL